MAGCRRDALLLTRDKGQSSVGSRIVVTGVLFGCIFALFTGVPTPLHIPSPSKMVSSACKSPEQVNALKVDILSAKEKNSELKKQVKDLMEKLRLAEQGKGHAQEQFVVLGESHKAGPFGTVKGLRTNPPVIPDESVNPRLAKILGEVAIYKELIVALANSNVKEMLQLWFTNIKRVGIPNYLVVALDDNIEEFCKSNDVPVYRRDPDQGVDVVGKSGGSHAVSGLKFRILREFLQLGYSVLLSDVDIVYLQNPFDYLYRDSDVESMSDGHNNSLRLLDRVATRLSKDPKSWDQAVFNEELFFPSHPGYDGLHAAKRTMDMYLFMNSMVLFKTVRKDAKLKKLKPVIVHVNYHHDKFARMKAIVEFYANGKQDSLDHFPDGSD
ncbi:hypothetical protein JHK82_048809 [Glycine max]|nr:hypothetical protein JHK86_048659 [Glycine max]KAG4944660.1 hypothetical protein JHK85_049306 [Glycine max]KAG5098955.1 hypothetical protein JHK82_048809 [Glycine max]KAG5103723.1 hypothetical protein JHK84_048692 [Glycine max]